MPAKTAVAIVRTDRADLNGERIAAAADSHRSNQPSKGEKVITLIPENYEQFLAADDGKPITMLNLLRFQPDGGRERYLQYLNMAGPIVARYGAEIVFVGYGQTALAAESGQSWDAVALVRYPTRRAFADMISDSDYAVADPVRKSALVEAVLQPIATVSN